MKTFKRRTDAGHMNAINVKRMGPYMVVAIINLVYSPKRLVTTLDKEETQRLVDFLLEKLEKWK